MGHYLTPAEAEHAAKMIDKYPFLSNTTGKVAFY
jgi:hypothetical protein